MNAEAARRLELAQAVILPQALVETAAVQPVPEEIKLRVGVDLGTAYLVVVVLDEAGTPLAGEWQFTNVVRDGLVLDFIGAVDLLRAVKSRLEARLSRRLTHAASGFPPGVPQVEVSATAHVLQAAGLECSGLLDEPSAANKVLLFKVGVIVDMGGGTTGIAIIRDGQVIYTADEPTGGTHFSLVIAGALGIPFEEAEALKLNPNEQARLYPLVRPVMEKVASIIQRHIKGMPVNSITLVGGTSAFQGMADVITEATGITAHTADHPLFVTPLGLALQDLPA